MPTELSRSVSHSEFVSVRYGVSSSDPIAMISALCILSIQPTSDYVRLDRRRYEPGYRRALANSPANLGGRARREMLGKIQPEHATANLVGFVFEPQLDVR